MQAHEKNAAAIAYEMAASELARFEKIIEASEAQDSHANLKDSPKRAAEDIKSR